MKHLVIATIAALAAVGLLFVAADSWAGAGSYGDANNLALTGEQVRALDTVKAEYERTLGDLIAEHAEIETAIAAQEAMDEPDVVVLNGLLEERRENLADYRETVNRMRADTSAVLNDAQREHFADACPWAITGIEEGDSAGSSSRVEPPVEGVAI